MDSRMGTLWRIDRRRETIFCCSGPQWSNGGGVQVSRFLALSAVVVAVIAPTVTLATTSSAASAAPRTWMVVPTGTEGTQSRYNGVSCVSTTWCMAVGDWNGTIGQQPYEFTLADFWAGSTSLGGTASRDAGDFSSLSSVSCTSSTFCVAVGNYYNAGSELQPTAFINMWSPPIDGVWSIPVYPTPGTWSMLNGVSCVSASYCVAVGASSTGSLVEVWNGSSWSIGNPGPVAGAWFNSISCHEQDDCELVGGDSSGSAIAAGWDGSPSYESLDPLQLTDYSDLIDVSCTTAATCLAVGQQSTALPFSSSARPLVASSSPRGWKVQAAPTGSPLLGVSCATRRDCVALDSSIVKWNGSSWTNIGTPDGTLSTVSCPTTAFCMAVGTQSTGNSQTLMVTYG
jgi:hypothetical protein